MRAVRMAWVLMLAILSLGLLTASGFYLVSAHALAEQHQAAAERLPRPTPAQLADAPRQARILGCISCHGEGLQGQLMADILNVVRVHAPNLTLIAARATDQQLAAAIRQGIGHDGRALFVMPSPMYQRLSGGEVSALIAWIRSLPRSEGHEEGVTTRSFGRIALVTGKLRPAPRKLADFRHHAPIDLGPAHAAGRSIAAKVCSGCHGPALLGAEMEDGNVAPDLSLAGAYDLEQFKTLMRTGKAIGGRNLGLMSRVAREDFSHFKGAEVSALHAYLRARAERLAN